MHCHAFPRPPTPPHPRPAQAARTHEESGIESTTAALVGHGEKYRRCGMQCVSDIAAYFKADFDLFQIEVPTEEGGRRRHSRRSRAN